jgi:hypothetical protein
MARHLHECPGCGEPVPSLFGALFHCDPISSIDDEDGDTEIRAYN